ncbi:MAG: glutathione S-transferase family protein [Labilithrix sp.]|nr:glutathione S-transferase family protein [Labilithrix sp.]MCW5811713.1 glutathione S-transferase family protein [Labilithrix sp.]
MKLYDADPSPNCFRVRTVIHELGLEVELVAVDLSSKAPKPAGLLDASPSGKVPAFVDDDGFALFESRAINTYLASKRPARGLYPDDPKRRAIVDQWSYWQAIHLGPAMQAVAFERVFKPKFGLGTADEALVVAKLAEVERLLPILERGLEGKEWLAGALTLADFAVASTFPLRAPAGISLAKVPNVEAWIARVEALPSWKRALPKLFAELTK